RRCVTVGGEIVDQHRGDLVVVLHHQDLAWHGGGGHAGLTDCGRLTEIARPPSEDGAARISPWCAATIARAIARPRPLPPCARPRAASARYNGSNTRPMSAAATPGALSSTTSVAERSPPDRRTTIRPGASV